MFTNLPSWNEQWHWKSLKKNSLKLNSASHNNANWHTDINGFLQHSPSRGNLYSKGPTLQKINLFLGGPPHMYVCLYIYIFFFVTFLFFISVHRKTCYSNRWQVYNFFFFIFFDSLFILLYKILQWRFVVNGSIFHRLCNLQFLTLYFAGNCTWYQQHITTYEHFLLRFNINQFFLLIFITVKASYMMFW